MTPTLVYHEAQLVLTRTCSAWGDADALAEAGFCYAQGVGCKKDLKKSARLYRQAESKGISMIGNSWYVLTGSPLSPTSLD